ncbi:PDZ domain-containing protein [Clostridium sp. AM30-24]|nr:PDZ domain-containing protein [Clostridium sp. AM30-24]
MAAVVVLGGIILFHEFGHYLLARLNGVAVVEFSVGFGPRILSWVSRKTGIRYSLKLLPLGGSCAMLGEFGEDEDEKEEIPDLKGVSFFDRGPLAKMAVIAAGPVFNFILAFVFSLVILSWAGIDPAVIAGTSEGMPAEAAGLREGDVITKLDGRMIHLSREISMYLMSAGQDPVNVEYRRYDEASSVWTTEHTVIRPEFRDGRYYLGVVLRGYRDAAKSPLQLLQYSAYEVRYWILTVLDSLKMIVGGKVTTNDIAGPVRIVTIIDQTVEENTQYGFVTVVMNLLNLMVMFSANLGVMNLLPFPALDGGRLVFLLWELVTGHPVSQRIEGAVNMTGMALLMTFMVFVVWNDLRILF